MYKNAMKNTNTAAIMEIKCGVGGVCVYTGAFARVHTHMQVERAILYAWSWDIFLSYITSKKRLC